MSEKTLKSYAVWDAPTRIFHWVNFISVIALIFFGFLILYRKEMSITGGDAKVVLKTVHTWVGYVLVASLTGRLLWGFAGNAHARWRAVLPSKRSLAALSSDISAFRRGDPLKYAGRGPMGRLSVSFMFLLLLILSATGLIRAGTDLYYPPFGGVIASYVAQPGVNPSLIKPRDTSLVVREKYDFVQKLTPPIGKIHIFTSWALLAMIGLHIASVVLKDMKQGGAIISAMFTGRKVLGRPPVDGDES